MSLPKIGFVGVGRMGAPMVSRLADAGYELFIFDNNTEAVNAAASSTTRPASSPADVLTRSDIVFLSLPTPEVVEAVALGADGLVAGNGARIVVDLSTTGPRVARTVAAGLAEKGLTPVDCPVSGGVGGAKAGTLALMVACQPETFAELEPILKTLGNPFYVGAEPGMGQMVKVINNLMSVTSLAIASEALVLGTKAGLDPNVMLEVINAGSGRNNATTDKIPKFVLGRGFDFGFAIGLSAKDARLCLEESDALGVPMIVGSAVRQLINVAKGRLGPDADLTEIIKPIEEWAGTIVDGRSNT